MLDKFNRNIDYARISVTDKCNLRCTYCMPSGNNTDSSCNDILLDTDILNICRALSNLGIKKIKITGGEPLIRKNIINLIKAIKSIDGIEQVTITTNGILLDKYLEELKAIDIDGINISIDAVDEDLFKDITGFSKVSKVIETINKAYKMGIKNIKINCVLIRGINEEEYTKLIELVKDKEICIKFIEMMPIGLGRQYCKLEIDEVKKKIENRFGKLYSDKSRLGNGPAEYYSIENLMCKVGFIGAVTHKFCSTCNRIRITSSGFLKTCLHFNTGVDLKPYVAKEELYEIIEKSILKKEESHRFEEKDDEENVFENKYMSQIGG